MTCFQHAFVAAIMAIWLAITILPSADAECCRPFNPGICYDCSSPTNFLEYCSAGPGGCNIFGCNCDGGCRKPKPGERGCFPITRLHPPNLTATEIRELTLNGGNERLNMKVYREQLRMDEILKAKEAEAK